MRGRFAFDDLLRDVDGVVHRDGEANAGIVAGVGLDQRVDADELAVLVNQRAAGVAGVDGRVGLNEVRVNGIARRRTGAGAAAVTVTIAVTVAAAAIGAGRIADDLRTAGGRHDARCDGLLKAERAADGHNPLADGQLVGIGELDGGKAAGIAQLHHGNVAAGIGADDIRVVLLTVDGDLQRVGIFDNVVVRDDVAVLGKHDAAAERAFGERAGIGAGTRSVTVAVQARRRRACRVHVDGGHGRKRLAGHGLGQAAVGVLCGDLGIARSAQRNGVPVARLGSAVDQRIPAKGHDARDGRAGEGEAEGLKRPVRLLLLIASLRGVNRSLIVGLLVGLLLIAGRLIGILRLRGLVRLMHRRLRLRRLVGGLLRRLRSRRLIRRVEVVVLIRHVDAPSAFRPFPSRNQPSPGRVIS